jgi:hypothetical protein
VLRGCWREVFCHDMYIRHISRAGKRRSLLSVIDLQTGCYGVMGIALNRTISRLVEQCKERARQLLSVWHLAFAWSQLAVMGKTLRMERNHCQRASPCALMVVCASGMWHNGGVIRLSTGNSNDLFPVLRYGVLRPG